jgi:hypothetical protein
MTHEANASLSEDFFDGLFEGRPAKWSILAFSVALTPVNACLLYCVIWYERFGSDL